MTKLAAFGSAATTHDVNTRRSPSVRPLAGIAAATALSGALVVGPAVFLSTSAAPQAQATAPVRAQDALTDSAGVLSDAQKSQIEDELHKLQQDKQIKMYVLFVDSFDGKSGTDWAKEQYETNPQSNVYIFAVAVDGNYGTARSSGLDSKLDDKVKDAAYPKLTDHDWSGAALAAVDAVYHADDSDGDQFGWVAGGAAAVIAAGGGIWYWNRRKVKKNEAEMVSAAKSLDPNDTSSLEDLPTNVLEQLSRDELTSTDASIRAAEEELKLAIDEFGEERTRPFSKAMEHSRRTLDRAFELRSRLDSAIPQQHDERRDILIEIVSSCGQADRQLDAQAASFADMRSLLLHSSGRLDELVQQTIALRSRLPQAKSTLDGLRARYADEALASVTDNVDMASEHISQAEQAIDRGRKLAGRPAGEQGGLVEAIRRAETSIGQADTLLSEVENAENRIAEAKDHLSALIQEVTDELTEAGELRTKSAQTGAEFNHEAMDAIATKAWEAVQKAEATRQTDPLSAYKELLAADEELDAQLDAARDSDKQHDRSLQIFDRAAAEARTQITSADRLISTRGRAVGSHARTLLVQAQQTFDQAMGNRNTDTRLAITQVREASKQAHYAEEAAQNDIRDFNDRNNSGSGSGGAFLAGMFVNSLFNGGGYGGFGGYGHGGGFGGGGFDGGGFGGGGYGGGSDGSF